MPKKSFSKRVIPMAAAIGLGAGVGILSNVDWAAAHEDEQAGQSKFEAQEIATVAKAPVSLDRAIAIAESKASGRALAAKAEEHKGAITYRVATVAQGKLYVQWIDPQSGALIATENEGAIERASNDEWGADYKLLTQQKTSLTLAVTAAETATGGKAVQADFNNENGRPEFHVEIASNGKVEKAVVDSASGKVVKTMPMTGENEDGEHENGENGAED